MSTAWYVAKRIAHAMGWLALLSSPAAILIAMIGDSMDGSQSDVFAGLTCLPLLAGAIVLWLCAIRCRWSLKWPLIIIAVAVWPFGLTWVMMIGLGKLIIHAVGRGSTVAGSYLDVPMVAEARPRGLVDTQAMSSKRGMALVMVIVSIAILAIALAAAASAFVSASRLTKHAAYQTAASDLAESEMERARSLPFDSIRAANVTTGLQSLPRGKCTVAVEVPEPGLKVITVTCSWVESKTPNHVRFSTLVAGGGR